MLKRSAFTLAEVLVAATIGTIFLATAASLMVTVSQWYPNVEAKTQLNDQARLLDSKIRTSFLGASFYEIYDWFPQSTPDNSHKVDTATRSKGTNHSGNMIVMAYSDADQSKSSNALSRLNGVTQPNINRIAGFFIDATDPNNPVLRSFDSVKPDPLLAGIPFPNPLTNWRKQFPITLPINKPATLTDYLPPKSMRTFCPVICRIDPEFIKNSIGAFKNNSRDTNGMLQYQTFYPITNQVIVNFSLRYGTNASAFVQPLTISVAFRK